MAVAGVILAGGRSSRMGGGDKPLLPLGHRTVLGHVVRRARPQVATLALNANGDPARFAAYGLPVIADALDGLQGPLAGILAALDWAQGVAGVERVATVTGDSPFVPRDLVARLVAAVDGQRPTYASSLSGQHPVFAVWPLSARDALAAFLAEQPSRRLMDAMRHLGAIEVAFDGTGPTDPFFNINTPEDLAAAELAATRTSLDPVLGIAGWKNAGKTTMTERLVAELSRRGHRVSTVKHAHHDADIDRPGTDTYRHRTAGAAEVALVTGRRWALMHESRGEEEPGLDEVLARLSPCDIVLVEGYRRAPIPKIELRRAQARDSERLAASDPMVLAVAADAPQDGETLPVFDLDDVAAIADFIVDRMALTAG